MGRGEGNAQWDPSLRPKSVCWSGSGRGCAQPPAHWSSQRNTACRSLTEPRSEKAGPKPTGVHLPNLQTRGYTLSNTLGNMPRGLTERTLRKFALTLFVLLLNDAVSSRRKHFFPSRVNINHSREVAILRLWVKMRVLWKMASGVLWLDSGPPNLALGKGLNYIDWGFSQPHSEGVQAKLNALLGAHPHPQSTPPEKNRLLLKTS